MRERLYDFLLSNNLVYVVCYNILSDEIVTVGDKNQLDNLTLIETLFSNKEQILSLNESLKEQIMPQAWKQGRVKCLVSNPTKNFIVGIFYHEEREIREAVKFGKEIDKKIKDLIRKINGQSVF